MKTAKLCFLVLALVGMRTGAQAQFTFITNNGAITITGYTGTNSDVVIPGITNGYPVRSIGPSAFLNCATVTKVAIPEGVTNIDFQAFTGAGLTSLLIPDTVVRIGSSAFMYCVNLASVTLGTGVKRVEHDAFYSCSSLTDVFIPEGLTNIYSTAFNDCTNLTSITVDPQNAVYSSEGGVLFDKNQTTLLTYPAGLPGNYIFPSTVTSVGDFAFVFCEHLTDVAIPGGVTNVGEYAFYGCNNVTNFSIPGSVRTLGQYSFSACTKLTQCLIPNGVTVIGAYAFSGTGLSTVAVPASVTNIGRAAFCSVGLTAITVDSNNPVFSSLHGVLFDGRQSAVFEFPPAKSGTVFRPGSYTVPQGVSSIRDSAFERCFLSSLTLPNTLGSIGDAAFRGCNRLTSLLIPATVTNIGNDAFDTTGVTNVVIPSSVTTLGSLGYCPGLQSLYFKGDAPSLPAVPGGIHEVIWTGLRNVTAYYLPGATGWDAYFQIIIPTAMWQPQLQLGNAHQPFSCTVLWAGNQTVVVEACTNLSQPEWEPLQTNTLTSDSWLFTDSQSSDYPRRFYRVRTP